MTDELPYIREARENLAKLVLSVDQLLHRAGALHASDQELTAKVADLQRLLRETEQRAVDAERELDEKRSKAERGERLDVAAGKLVQVLDKLPTSMADAHLTRGVKPAIPLYGTYEWKAVTEAKFLVMQELKERRTI